MTRHERTCFNDALDRLKALQWRDRVVEKLNFKIAPLSASKKIELLRKVEHLIDTGKLPPEGYDRSGLDADDLAALQG